MKKIVRMVSIILMTGSVCGNVLAADNDPEVKPGTIRGKVIDADKQTLPGASVFIENLETGTISDVDGFYTLSNLPPGVYTVKVSYLT